MRQIKPGNNPRGGIPRQFLKGYLGDQAKIAKLLNPISRFFEREIDVIRAWYAFSQHEGDKGLIVYLDVTDETKADEIIPGVNAYMDEVLDELLAEEEWFKVSQY